ncbi:hypothetical protein GQ600_772 [Phytophthora cactorum]|nr:hypothetical protein GQ600_772 [Phytophthora cactorum]
MGSCKLHIEPFSQYELAAAGSHVREALESDEKKPRREKKDKSKKRKKDSKKIKKSTRVITETRAAAKEEDDENPKVTETKAALPRDEWMAMPFMGPTQTLLSQSKQPKSCRLKPSRKRSRRRSTPA